MSKDREKTLESQYGNEYKCTLLINTIRQLSDTDDLEATSMLRSSLLGLMQNKATLNIPDSDGRDAMSYAVMSNNTALVRFLIENRQGGILPAIERES